MTPRIPPLTTPVAEAEGSINPLWHRYFQALQSKIGDANGLPDAPNNGLLYARRNQAWQSFTIPDPINPYAQVNVYNVGYTQGMYPSVQAAVNAINAGQPPSSNNRSLIYVWPGKYFSESPVILPSFCGIKGVAKDVVQFQNNNSDLFICSGDNYFDDFLIDGANNSSLYAFDGNDKSNIVITRVELTSNSLPVYGLGDVSSLRFNGANASTTMTDLSGKIWTARGNAQLSTAWQAGGTASLLLDGNGDWIDTPTSTDFNFGTGAFGIQCWVRPTSLANNFNSIFANATATYSSTSRFFSLYGSAAPVAAQRLKFGCGGFGLGVDQALVLSTTTVAINTNYFVEVSRDAGGTLRLFVNGNLEASTNAAGITMNFSDTATRIGANGWDGVAGNFTGYIDTMIVRKGAPFNTASYTAPALTLEPAYSPAVSGTSAQKFLKQSGPNWTVLYLEKCRMVYSTRSSDYSVLIESTTSTARQVDVLINDVFFDAYNLTSAGGSFLLRGGFGIAIKRSTIRGEAVFNTGIRLERGLATSGTPSVEVRMCDMASINNSAGGTSIFNEAGTAVYVSNSDAPASVFNGTVVNRNSFVS